MPINNLSQLVRAIRNGEVKLDKEHANKAMELAAGDAKVAKSDELDLLRDLADSAPEGTDYGRSMLRNFVTDAQARFDKAEFHLDEARALLADDVGARLPPQADYVKSDGIPTEVRAKTKDELVGRKALLEIVRNYSLAYESAMAPSLGQEDKINPKVMAFYEDFVANQPLPEDDPLAPVRDYLEANFTRPPAREPGSTRGSSSSSGGLWGPWLRLWGW